MALFSVIIPIYNVEKYLKQCVDSVISQTFSDLEIILVDDGSTDNCPAICDSYASDPRVKIIHKPNGGVVSARKAGAKAATAEYIACIDGDDWIESDYFEKFAKAIEEHPSDVICSGYIVQSKDGTMNPEKMKERPGYYKKEDIEKVIFPYLLDFNPPVCGKIFKRDVFTEVQMSVDDVLKMAEDACVVVICVYLANDMYVIDDCLYDYRFNPSSITKGKSVYNLEEPKLIATHFMKYIVTDQIWFKQQIYNTTVNRLYNRCVSRFNQEKPYREISAELDHCLDDPFYQECIKKSNYSLNNLPKRWVKKQILKLRAYRLMKVLS